MDKQQILDLIRRSVDQNVLTKTDIDAAFGVVPAVASAPAPVADSWKKHVGVSNVFYYLGAIVVVVGLIILITQNWRDIPSFTKILITLGCGIASYIAATLLMSDERTKSVSIAFYIISSALIPIGFAVFISENSINVSGSQFGMLVAGTMLVLELVPYYFFKRSFFVMLSIIFGTWFYYSVLAYFMPNEIYRMANIWNYLTLALGVAYILLAQYFKNGALSRVGSMLNSLGIIAILGSTLMIGKVWDLVYPAILLGLIFQSVYVKSRPSLVLGAIFTVAYIIKITNEYFARDASWPVLLVIIGFVLIGVGYLTVYLNKKYISQKV